MMNIGEIIVCVCLILLKSVKLECKFACSAMRIKIPFVAVCLGTWIVVDGFAMQLDLILLVFLAVLGKSFFSL